MPKRQDFHKAIIGRAEALDFVELGIVQVPAKADTGAYRSAAHAQNITIDEASGELRFELLGGHPLCGSMMRSVATDEFSKVWVANSFGQREERYEVKLKVKIGSKVFKTRFTLADRSKKIYPILMGRKLLSQRFLVDPAITSLDRVELREQFGIEFPNDEEEGRDENSNSI